jgi:hypothetical protein
MWNWIKTKLFTIPINWFILPYRWVVDIYKELTGQNIPTHTTYYDLDGYPRDDDAGPDDIPVSDWATPRKDSSMGTFITFLLSIVRAFGDKLPLAIPIITNIYNEVMKLIELYETQARRVLPRAAMQKSDEAVELRDLLVKGGVDNNQAEKMVDTFERFSYIQQTNQADGVTPPRTKVPPSSGEGGPG